MAKVSLKERKTELGALLDASIGSTLTAELAAKINGVFGSQPTSNKIDADGNVFCNYFKVYLPEEEFATSKSGKLDSMSKEGKRLHRTQKSMVNKATSEVLKSFKNKEVDSAEMAEILSSIDENSAYRFPQGTDSLPVDYPFSV